MNNNKFYIIRGDRSGAFFGQIEHRDGQEVTIKNCRRIWYWAGAASLSQLAKEGVKWPKECKFTVTVQEMIVLDAIELILCTEEAVASIKGAEEWKV